MSLEIRTRDSARKVKMISGLAVLAGTIGWCALQWHENQSAFLLDACGVLFLGGLIGFIIGRFME